MQRELTAYEVYIRNWHKRKKQAEDQEMLDQMGQELKQQHEKQRQQTIARLRDELKRMEV